MFLLGPGGGILANVLLYIPLSIFLLRVRYTGHTDREHRPPQVSRLGFGEMWQLISRGGLDRRVILMIALGGTASFFVGSGFQAQMPEYAHHHGHDDAAGWYTGLLGANAAGAVAGALLMEILPGFQPTVRAAIIEASRLVPELVLVAGGKSFGGRMTSQAQAASPEIGSFRVSAGAAAPAPRPAARRDPGP